MSERGRKVVPKSQKQISKGMHTPYSKEAGNPNNSAYQVSNRSNQVSFKGDTVKPFTVGLEDIDSTILYYFNNVIKPSVVQNGTRIEVPVVYADSERWNQIQKDGYFRDRKGRIMMPLIVPDYITLNYDCIISTYYVEQMNNIIEAINYASDSYWGNPERFQFRARIDSVATNVELNKGQDRVVKSTFSIKMYGYIVPNILQKDLASIKKYHSKVKLVFNPEVISDMNEVTTPPLNRTNIEHGDFTEFTDPPSTQVPNNRINTNRVPPTPTPE